MNVKQTVKKMSALATGAVLLGATVMGAVAYDLSDYPHPMVQDGAVSGYIVVGTKGANALGLAQDMVGAVDLGASLQAAAKTPVTVSGGSVSVEGGEDYEDQVLNGVWSAVTLTESKLEGFKDTTTDFNDEDIDYHDELSLGAGALNFRTSAVEEDFGNGIYLTTDASAITYRVYFDDAFNTTDVGTDSDEDELEFYFLGKWVTVQSVDSDGNGISIEASSEHFLEEGDSVTVDEHEVTLVRVGESSVIVSVDGQSEVIADGDSETFDDADDFEVEVQSIFYIEGAADNGANLKLGADLTESAQDGNSVELFGEPKEEDEADWLWDINMPDTTSDGTQYLGIVNNIDRTNLDEGDEDRPALAIGDELALPNNYASIWFYAVEEPADLVTLKVEVDDGDITVDDGDDVRLEDKKGLVFTTDSGNDDFVVGSVETSKVYVIDNGGHKELWYEDGDDDVNASTTTFKVKLDTDEVTITPPTAALTSLPGTLPTGASVNSSVAWNMDFDSVDDLWFFVDVNNDYFGLEDDEESEELTYYNGSTYTAIGTKDYDWVTNYGAVIAEPESQFSSGSSFEVQLPQNRQYGTVVVTSRGSMIGGGDDDSGAYTINKVELGLAILDTEAEDMLGDSPLIVVGGPYVNSVAAELMGNPTAEQIGQMFEPGKAKIKLYADKDAILVAGYSAQDTTGAARVLADYTNPDYEMTGTEVEVVVPSLSQISIREPTLPSTVDDLTEETE